jgi:hypothetical protein
VRPVVGRLEQIGADIAGREIQDRQLAVLMQQLGLNAVDNGVSTEPTADAAWGGLKIDEPCGVGHRAVEGARGIVTKGAGAECEGHSSR